MKRRHFLQSLPLAAIAARFSSAASAPTALHGELGITTGSFMRNITAGKFKLIDLPRIMRDELGMRVIDLMTATLESLEPNYLDRLRGEAEKAGCVLTNLK